MKTVYWREIIFYQDTFSVRNKEKMKLGKNYERDNTTIAVFIFLLCNGKSIFGEQG